jgi:Zn-dependent M28 family amino/carboxypeptidase
MSSRIRSPFRSSPLGLAVALAAAVSFAAARTEPRHYLDHVRFLSSPELQGRGAGTPGIEKAAAYIEQQFRQLGLKPAGVNGSYTQPFQVTTGAKPGKHNRLAARGEELRMGEDYIPLSFSSNGSVEAPVVFAGYGITAPEFHYDDYAHVDVKDKVVMVLRYEPKHFQKDTTRKRGEWTHHSHLSSKAINARNHGAKAVLLVDGDKQTRGPELIRFGVTAGPEDVGILIAQLRSSIATDLVADAGKSLTQVQKQIEEKSAPVTFALPEKLRVALQVDVERERATVRNVLGYLPGKSSEYIIIGAHYDHLGLGNESSLAPSQIGRIHPGADDNASGTAGVLELARLLSGRRNELPRGVLFMTFAGEEIGLLGSSEWVTHPTLPLKDAVAMLNMDMIGRVNGSKLYIGGTGTGSTFEEIVKRVAGKYEFQADFSQQGYSSSDHTSFLSKSIPSLFFFSGLHGDYHKPTDTWNKINAEASARVVDMVYDIATELIDSGARPQYVKVVQPHGGQRGGSGAGGYGPYFGSIPDFAQSEKGVRFSDVRPESPAAKAGLQAGDVLISFAGKPVNNLYDFTYLLQGSSVGDVVEVRYLRNGKEQTAKVTLEARR